MAGERKREARAALVTKAILLGYHMEVEGGDWWNLQLPNGDWLLEDGLPKTFKGAWRAAKEALKLSGVPCD